MNMKTIIFATIFLIFFIPFLGEKLTEGVVKKENYIQSLKLTLFLFVILSIPVLVYLLWSK